MSWAHGDDAWQETIARFVEALRTFGIHADVDLFHTHKGAVDWSTYGPTAIKKNDFVLIATSATYKELWEDVRRTHTGAGAAREANVLKDLLDRDPTAFFMKVLIVLLPGARDADVPAELAGLPRFGIPDIDEQHLEDLLRRLTDQPAYVAAPPGPVPVLPRARVGAGATAGTLGDRDRLEAVAASFGAGHGEPDGDVATRSADSEAARDALENRGRRSSSPSAALVLGCMMGRRSVYCSALATSAIWGVPASADVRVMCAGHGSRLPPEQRGSEALYDELAAAVLGSARDVLSDQPAGRISAIGIATPGVVELSTGRLLLSVTVPDGSDIPMEIATRLMDKQSDVVERAFGVPSGEPQKLADRILVDNDARCVARHYLSQRNWANFACVYVGSGVGAGMVVDGNVYYGSNGSAGRIGHIQLERDPAGWTLDDEHHLPPVRCDCGVLGYHFDPMAGFAGLQRIADLLADDDVAAVLSGVKEAYLADGAHHVDFYRDGFPQLLALAHRRNDAGVPRPVLTLLERHTGIDDYLAQVLNAYARILASGIATLTELFDPGNVVLCGPLIDILRTSDGFYRALRQLLPQEVSDPLASPRLTVEGRAREALWRGAALLPCERGFPAAMGATV